MKNLTQYIHEAIKPLQNGKKGIIVFDIDDTLLTVDPNGIHVYKQEPGKKEIALTPAEYAKDPDAGDPEKLSWFSYREFRDPQKVYQSIVTGTPIIKNLKILQAHIRAGYDFCFLTARSCEDVVKTALDKFLVKRNSETGEKEPLGDIFKKTLSAAVNDDIKKYPGKTDSEKKGNVLKEICKKYDKVIFVDDDEKNVNAAKELGIDNLRVIKAWED